MLKIISILSILFFLSSTCLAATSENFQSYSIKTNEKIEEIKFPSPQSYNSYNITSNKLSIFCDTLYEDFFIDGECFSFGTIYACDAEGFTIFVYCLHTQCEGSDAVTGGCIAQ